VGVYLDGVYLGQSQALDQSLDDIEQIEILRGPQGHLFGRNTDAGAVSITTRAPSKAFEGALSAGVSNYSGYEAGGYVSGPLATGVQGKLSVSGETRDGFISNVYDGSKLSNLQRFATRGQLALQPSEKLKVDLYADYAKIDQNLVMGVPTSGSTIGPTPVPLPAALAALPPNTVDFNTRPVKNSELAGLSMTINFALDGGNKLTAITGYRDTRQARTNDNDYGPNAVFSGVYADHFKQASQEVRIASPNSGSLRYVAGLYLLNEEAATNREARVGAYTGPAIYYPPAHANIPLSMLGVLPGAVISNNGKITTHTYALFGGLDYELAQDWTLNLGARYTDETKDLLFNLNGVQSGSFAFASLDGYTDSRSESRFTPTAGLSYALNPQTRLYAKYSTGFKSGGWNADFLSKAQVAAGFKFNTETVTSYEAGVKGNLLNGRLQYEVAAYSSKFENYQVFQYVQVGAQTALVLNNAARVDTHGLEASARERVSRDFDIGVNLGLMSAAYEHFPNGGGPGVDYSGQVLADTPRMTVSLTAAYRIAVPNLGGRFELSGDYSHRDSTVLGGNFANLGSRDLVNARLAFKPNNGSWSANVWVRNLSNQRYVIARGQDFLGNQFIAPGLPRLFGLAAKYDF
jgi:iron complex outermembrane receptor protein